VFDEAASQYLRHDPGTQNAYFHDDSFCVLCPSRLVKLRIEIVIP